MKQKLLLAFLCLGLLSIYFACEKDDSVVKEEQTVDSIPTQITPTLKTVSYDNAGETFNRLKTELQIGPYFQLEQNDGVLSRNTQDTLGITIFTDVIKEIIAGDYSSYTMLIITPNTTESEFYNLTIENKNGEASMFITQYKPTEYWINNKDQKFEGEVATMRIASFDQAPDPFTETVEENGSTVDTSGSFDPDSCEGTLIITGTLAVPYPCACGDWTQAECTGCPEYPHRPGTNYEFIYACVPHYTGNPYDGNENPDNGNSNTGGGTTNNDNTNPDEGQSMGATVTDDEVPCEPPFQDWDTNQNCTPDNDIERCNMRHGNGSSICDCVAGGQSEVECEILNCVAGASLEGLNEVDKRRISTYIQLNGCTDGTTAFIELAIEALDGDGADDGEVDFEEQIVFTNSFKQTKAYCVFNALLESNNNLFRNTISQFSSNDSSIPLIFDHGPIQYLNGNGELVNDNTTEANTHFDEEIEIAVITFNSNTNSVNDNTLNIAGTLLHEGIHAELFGIIQTNNNLPNPISDNQYQYMLNLLEYFENNNSPMFINSNAQHTFMIHNHVTKIAETVRSFDNNQYTLEHYMAFGWEGLTGIGIPSNIITSEDEENYNNLAEIPKTDSNETPCD